jgi:hypothetical protein
VAWTRLRRTIKLPANEGEARNAWPCPRKTNLNVDSVARGLGCVVHGHSKLRKNDPWGSQGEHSRRTEA